MGKKTQNIPGYRQAVQALLPEGELCADESRCLLCADGEAQPAAWYAFLDMGCIEEGEQGPALVYKNGKKGLAAPLQVPCCDRCKKNWNAVSRVLPLCTIAGLAAAAVVGVGMPIRNALAQVHTALPFAAAALFAAAGVLAGIALKKRAVKKRSAHTDFNWEHIPYIGEMQKKGWFFLSKSRPVSPVFSKEKRADGR